MASEDLLKVCDTMFVSLDESLGEQTGGTPIDVGGAVIEDNNDDDLDPSVYMTAAKLPFFNHLTVDLALSTDPVGVAKSSGDVVTFAGAVSVGFTDANGDPLEGDDSGLTTLDGDAIYLYTDPTNDNIALGRVADSNGDPDPDGAIAFVVILNETSGTTGELWTILYQPLAHGEAGEATDASLTNPDSGQHDDALDLTDKLFVTAVGDVVFSDFSKAPSGQNDWLGFGAPGGTNVQLLVTGLVPLEAQNNKFGDTVNTSNIGLGSNKQSVEPGDGLRIDFVTGLNLPPQGGGTGDTKNVDGISYTNHNEGVGAGFQLVQVQGKASNTVDVKVYLYDADNDQGASFVPGINDAGDTPRQIGEVRVLDAAGNLVESSANPVANNGITITLNGDHTATVTGLLTGQQVIVLSAGEAPCDRLVVENISTGKTDGFDVGTIRQIGGGEIDTDEVGSNIVFEDDGPAVDVTVKDPDDEPVLNTQDAETDGDPKDEDDDTSTANFGDVFAIGSSSFGADGAGTAPDLDFKLGLKVAEGTASGLTIGKADIFLFEDNGVITGSTESDETKVDATNTVFTVSVDADGKVTLTQLQQVDHGTPDDAAPYDGDQVTLEDGKIELTASASIEDADGDTASDSETIDLGGNLVFDDDGPAVDVVVDDEVEEPVLNTQDAETDGDPTDKDEDTSTENFGGVFAIGSSSFGADGEGTAPDLDFKLSLVAEGTKSGLTIGGADIYLFEDNGVITGSTESDETKITADNTVFTLSVDEDGKVTLTQLQQVDHSQSDDAAPYDGDQVTLEDGKIELTASASIEDADGDTASDSETIDLGGNLVFDDDGPDAEDDVDSVKEDTGDFATGNVIVPGDGGLGETDDNTDDGIADAAGADGLDGIEWKDVVDDAGGDYVLGTYGKLYVDADGNYKYDLDDTNADLATLDDGETATDTFTYTITDGDGDTSTATLTITIDGSTDDKAKGSLDVSSCVFEDLQPLQFKGDGTQQFEKLEITFTPEDNETATAARLTIPTGWQVQVWDTTGGGSEVALLSAGTDVDIGTYIASVLDGTYELRPIPPENSDVDADFSLEIDIKDPDSGLTNTLSKDFTVLVDAVADLPTNVTITTIDTGKTSAGKDADTANNFTFGKDETGSVTVSANFSDLDGSEVHTIKIDLSDGDFQFDNPGTAAIDYADSGSGQFKYNYKGTDYQIDFSFTTDGVMELTIPTEIGEFSKTFNIRNTGKDSVAVENFESTVFVEEEPEDGGCADDGSDLNVEGQAGDNTAEVSVSPQRPNILNGTFITNTNVQKQLALLTFVDSVDPLRAFAQILVRGSQGQQGAILSDAGFLIDAVHEHLVSVEATAGTKVIITDFDLEGVVIVDPGNAQLEVNDVPGGPDSTGLVQLITPSTEAGTLQAFESSKDDATGTASNLADSNAGNAGNADYVFGGTQNDTITATAGPNVLNGGNILDPVTADKDAITGGSGTDVLVFDGGDSLNGGAGFDILRIDEGAIFNTMTKEGLSTSGLDIDATVDLTNQNISNIESILITEEATVDDKAGTKLILEAQDVLDFTDNSKDADGLNGDTLYIIGSKGDSVELNLGDVTFTTQAVNDTARGMTFTQYNLSNGGTLIVDTDVSVDTNP